MEFEFFIGGMCQKKNFTFKLSKVSVFFFRLFFIHTKPAGANK
ncbi:hypothetical protein BDD43_1970 [Mucilaginibacter gracilis]|uniref:Uncharacterized protein n=1 Tax=Mucilaginibacter gracilis TaxID=423350 RepID=A0A495J0I4_9SPHI|nr:hypothetical protein BDD43_1970 [Mucilaginibacter gracilis]